MKLVFLAVGLLIDQWIVEEMLCYFLSIEKKLFVDKRDLINEDKQNQINSFSMLPPKPKPLVWFSSISIF